MTDPKKATPNIFNMNTTIIKLSDLFVPENEDDGQARVRSVKEFAVLERAYNIQETGLQQPLKVTLQNKEIQENYPYEIVDGNGRYWAFTLMDWVANGKPEPILNDKNEPTGEVKRVKIDPIKIFKKEKGEDVDTGMVIDGTYLGKKYDGTLPVVIQNEVFSPLERKLRQLSANTAKPMKKAEYLKVLQEYQYENPNLKAKEIAKHFGMPLKTYHQLCATMRLPEEAITKVIEDKIPLNRANAIAKAVTKIPVEDIKDLCAKAEDKKVGIVELQKDIDRLVEVNAPEKVKDKEFAVVPKIRKKDELLEQLELVSKKLMKAKKSGKGVAEATAEFNVMRWVTGTDEESEKEQRRLYDEAKAKKEKAKANKAVKDGNKETIKSFGMLIFNKKANYDIVPEELKEPVAAYVEALKQKAAIK